MVQNRIVREAIPAKFGENCRIGAAGGGRSKANERLSGVVVHLLKAEAPKTQ